jgi:hypothetical protein
MASSAPGRAVMTRMRTLPMAAINARKTPVVTVLSIPVKPVMTAILRTMTGV